MNNSAETTGFINIADESQPETNENKTHNTLSIECKRAYFRNINSAQVTSKAAIAEKYLD